MHKQFVLAEVKTVDSEAKSGEFEAILSAPTTDRDGEVIDAKAFEPLPDSIPIHAYHDFSDPVGRAAPYYDGDVLKARGTFASTPRAQEIRTLVTEGVIASMSVGFMSAARTEAEGTPHIVTAELLEGSFVSVPSNRQAAVLLAKSYEGKGGASLDDLIDAIKQLSDRTADTTPAEQAGAAAAEAAAAPADSRADVEVAQAKALAAEVDLLLCQ